MDSPTSLLRTHDSDGVSRPSLVLTAHPLRAEPFFDNALFRFQVDTQVPELPLLLPHLPEIQNQQMEKIGKDRKEEGYNPPYHNGQI
ncbi:hypothetical protein [Litoribacter populi]|uniref:hypothetical protein n=1 Tax=Litoribacter populi TaxID=2598460 RepID=UPI00117F26A0|nr:hypothetical protein [Litoribacter populi]